MIKPTPGSTGRERKTWLCGGFDPVDKRQNRPFQHPFDPSSEVHFQGSQVASDSGVLPARELDERLGLRQGIAGQLTNSARRFRLPWLRNRLVWVTPVLPFLAFLLLVYRGIDFGVHWDEFSNNIEPVAYSLQNGFTLLPSQYGYPGVGYWLTFSASTPELGRAIVDGKRSPEELKNTLVPVLRGEVFRLRLRRVFGFVTALTAVWIYFAVLVWGRSWLEALYASLLFAFSWEMVYHARWIAPDSILMQFGALTLLLVSVAWRTGSRWALYSAVVAAGFGCGSKYPGALLLLPILAVIWLGPHSKRRAFGDSALVMAIFIGSYLITTPGTLLQPIKFYSDVTEKMHIYATGFLGYSVHPGIRHLSKIFKYFGTQLGSTFQLISVLLMAFGFAGAWALIKESWRNALIVLLFPVVYLLYFSSQAAMIVRNYLVVAPFLFLLMARGVFWTSSKLRWERVRVGFVAIIVLLIAVNAIDQVKAAESVAKRRNVSVFVDAFERYTQAHPNWTFLISPKLERELRGRNFWGKNLSVDTKFEQPYQVYASYYSEAVLPIQRVWQTNRPRTFLAIFGPREVNLDYYTGWWGDDRIVCLSPKEVRRSILPYLPVKRFQWIGEVSFDGVANGAREPLIVTGKPGEGDYLYVLRVDPRTVRVYWNRFGVGDTAGATLQTEKGQRHSLTVDIDFEGGKSDAQIDGATVLNYRGPIYPSGASQILIGKNGVGLGYIGPVFGGTMQEVTRQVDW